MQGAAEFILAGFQAVEPRVGSGYIILQGAAEFVLAGFQAVEPRVGGGHIIPDNLGQFGDGGAKLLKAGRQLPDLVVQNVLPHRFAQLGVARQDVQNVLKGVDGGHINSAPVASSNTHYNASGRAARPGYAMTRA